MILKTKKSCTEILDSGLQLKVWGIQTSRRLLSEIIGDKDGDNYWKQWITINDYCLYVIISNKNGRLTNAEEEYCKELSSLLKKEVKEMRNTYNNSALNDPACKKILALERAILTLQTRFERTGALNE